MRLNYRLLKAANQNISAPKAWMDPVYGYWESHGKMEFKAGEEYNLTDEEKKAVLWRYRVKEILKKEYLRREYDPNTFRYKEGVVMDPAMFRWYSSEMTNVEFFRATPRSVCLYLGGLLFGFYLSLRLALTPTEKRYEECTDGKILWWDRQLGREVYVSGSGHCAPTYGLGY